MTRCKLRYFKRRSNVLLRDAILYISPFNLDGGWLLKEKAEEYVLERHPEDWLEASIGWSDDAPVYIIVEGRYYEEEIKTAF